MLRKIHFFSIQTDQRDNAPAHLFSDALEHIFTQAPGRKTLDYRGEQGEAVRLAAFGAYSGHFRGRIVKYRANHMTTGTLSDDTLNDFALESGSLFAEVTHFIYLPAAKILAIEYNHNGPREGTLLWYVNGMLHQLDGEPEQFISRVILDPNVLQKLERAGEVRLLELAIPQERITNGSEMELFSALRAAASIGNPGQIGVTLSGSKKRGDRRALMTNQELLAYIRSGEINLGLFGKATVRIAYEHQTELINLLENKLVSNAEILGDLTNDRVDEWFTAILNVYKDNRSAILKTLGPAA